MMLLAWRQEAEDVALIEALLSSRLASRHRSHRDTYTPVPVALIEPWLSSRYASRCLLDMPAASCLMLESQWRGGVGVLAAHTHAGRSPPNPLIRYAGMPCRRKAREGMRGW